MCYYTFELDEKSKNMCVAGGYTFGKFQYKRLPMGVSQAPDLCQEIMESILKDIPDVEVFLRQYWDFFAKLSVSHENYCNCTNKS
jgi:hypothetical protein